MNAQEINFLFGDKHCYRDFGCWFEWDTRPMAAKTTRDSYAVSGRSGTVLLSGTPIYDEMQLKGKLHFAQAPVSEAAAARAWRNVIRWLKAGRQRLILDCEPDRYYLAQVDDSIPWSNAGWDEGELTVVFTLQPYSFALSESTAMATLDAIGMATLTVDSATEVPISLLVTNTGLATLTGLSIHVGDAVVTLTGMEIDPGDQLEISMEEPIGALRYRTEEGVTLTADMLPYAVAFDPLLGSGRVTVGIAPTFAEATGGEVTALARARGVAV